MPAQNRLLPAQPLRRQVFLCARLPAAALSPVTLLSRPVYLRLLAGYHLSLFFR